VAGLTKNYGDWARADVAQLKDTLQKLNHARGAEATALEHRAALRTVAHNMAGVAGTFGYDLVTSIGRQLCDYLDALDEREPVNVALVEIHARALETVVTRQITGDGGALGREIMTAFAVAVAKSLAGTNRAD
jgi:chemotaxis protein histidine kinase CheA